MQEQVVLHRSKQLPRMPLNKFRFLDLSVEKNDGPPPIYTRCHRMEDIEERMLPR